MMMTHDVKLMSILNSYMMNGKGNSMDKVRRVERMVAMTKLLVDSPQKLIPLNYFCDFLAWQSLRLVKT